MKVTDVVRLGILVGCLILVISFGCAVERSFAGDGEGAAGIDLKTGADVDGLGGVSSWGAIRAVSWVGLPQRADEDDHEWDHWRYLFGFGWFGWDDWSVDGGKRTSRPNDDEETPSECDVCPPIAPWARGWQR